MGFFGKGRILNEVVGQLVLRSIQEEVVTTREKLGRGS